MLVGDNGCFYGEHGLSDERYKFMLYRQLEGMNELSDLQQDPFELRNLVGTATSMALRRRNQPGPPVPGGCRAGRAAAVDPSMAFH